MTPYQFGRLSQKQRMLAGLNSLGFSVPGTVEGSKFTAMANTGLNVKTGTGTSTGSTFLATTPVQKANTLAPPGGFKNVIGSTLQQPSVSSGIDARNSSAANLLTASADKLNLRRNTVKQPPTYSKLPGSNITPTQPAVAPNPINNAFLDKQLAKAKRDLELQLRAQSVRSKAGGQLIQDALNKAKESAGAAETQARTSDPAPTTAYTQNTDPRSDYRPSDFYEPSEATPPGADLTLLDQQSLPAAKPFPTAMVVAGVGVLGLVAYLFLKD